MPCEYKPIMCSRIGKEIPKDSQNEFICLNGEHDNCPYKKELDAKTRTINYATNFLKRANQTLDDFSVEKIKKTFLKFLESIVDQ